jgi:hypothetical protein
MNPRTLAGLLLGAACLLLAAPSQAYVRTVNGARRPVKWANTCVLITAHTYNAPKALDGAGVLRAVNGAGNMWGRPSYTCTPLTLSAIEERTEPGIVKNDGINRVMFVTDRWCRHNGSPDAPCYNRGTLAITTITAHADGTIVDADVEVNAINFRWDDLVARPLSDGQDLQSVLLHEFGHLNGLDHNCYYPGSTYRGVDDQGNMAPECNISSYAVTSTVMYPSASSNGTVKRRLSADETRFICDIYPAPPSILPPVCGPILNGPGTDTDPGDEAGGCSVGTSGPGQGTTGSGPAGLALMGILLGRFALGRRRRR